MTIGECPCCGCKIGRKTANGRYLPDQAMMSQISLVFGYSDGRPGKTRVHVACCRGCADTPSTDSFMKGLAGDENYEDFKKSAPDMTLERIERDVLPWEVGSRG